LTGLRKTARVSNCTKKINVDSREPLKIAISFLIYLKGILFVMLYQEYIFMIM